MPLSRHFEIVYMLLHKKKVTADELAEHFEVSTRTIYRDIDTLSAAGIPIYSSRGKGAEYH
uniref:HTH domain-containing protein n=1 Tax=Paenibacillus polymyxa TaxID=1406 RepID=A0AAE9PQ71_PAEPO